MRRLIINGRFLTQRLTGVQRYALEILREFAKTDGLQAIVALPPDAEAPQEGFDGVEFVRVGKLHGRYWEQISLPRYCRKQKLPLLNTGNRAPLFFRSNVILHDVVYLEKLNASFSKKWIFGSKVEAGNYIPRAENLFTVSDFSKSRICHFYPKAKEPVVAYNGHEHILRIGTSPVEGLPEEFYLSVGSVVPHKNFKYILYLAKNNPDRNFVIVGNLSESFDRFLKENEIENCYFTGYLSDEQLMWLYKRCQGFILPSLYEGFGIPPLEAVTVGCRKIYLSDIPVFREIFGDCAKFFDPNDYENTVALDGENTATEEAAQALLEKCSWKRSAKIIVDTIFGEKE